LLTEGREVGRILNGLIGSLKSLPSKPPYRQLTTDN
jgi:hypothetical protein